MAFPDEHPLTWAEKGGDDGAPRRTSGSQSSAPMPA